MITPFQHLFMSVLETRPLINTCHKEMIETSFHKMYKKKKREKHELGPNNIKMKEFLWHAK